MNNCKYYPGRAGRTRPLVNRDGIPPLPGARLLASFSEILIKPSCSDDRIRKTLAHSFPLSSLNTRIVLGFLQIVQHRIEVLTLYRAIRSIRILTGFLQKGGPREFSPVISNP